MNSELDGGAGPRLASADRPRTAPAEGAAPNLAALLERRRQRVRHISATPDKVGRYIVKEVKGRGGMGVVYAAVDPHLNRDVAVKVIRPEYAESPAFQAQFVQESRAMAGVKSPNVVTVHHAEVDEAGHLFLVMELSPGTSLQHLLRSGQALPRATALELGIGLAIGLTAAHAHGAIHGDVNPNNVLVEPGPDGTQVAKLTDFGLARFVEDSGSSIGCGTPGYRSPEQIDSNQNVTVASDVYGLGAVLYRMLTGRLPVADEPLQFPSRSRVPRPLRRLCVRCLQADPNARPPAAEVVQALKAYRARWRRRLLVAGALAATLLTGVLGATWWFNIKSAATMNKVRADMLHIRASSLMTSPDPAKRAQAEREFRAAVPVFRKHAARGEVEATMDLAEVLCNLATLAAPDEGLNLCDEAERALNQTGVPPNNDIWAFTWLTRGTVLQSLGQTEKSFEDLTRARTRYAELAPTVDRDEFKQHHATARLNLAKQLIRRNDFAAAVQELDAAVAIWQSLLAANRTQYLTPWIDARYTRGIARYGYSSSLPTEPAAAERATAIQDFSEVIAEQMRSVEAGNTSDALVLLRALMMRHGLFVRQGRAADALKDAEQAITINDRFAPNVPGQQIDALRKYVQKHQH
ncbi:protein kinase [Gemmata sp. JC673]|uniref:Protein kinase n=1 Tax=Gemmata algarum TaxID=2975278 RepID=A0ABU5F3X5_9BACT|nr:protein kinase [Gemmata algarum]MDY3562255.1 protein kinase [Gemmata algarum]